MIIYILYYNSMIHVCVCSIVPTEEDIASLPHFRRDQLLLTKFLGSGAFGEVFEGLASNILSEDSGNTKVAVKVCSTLLYITQLDVMICLALNGMLLIYVGENYIFSIFYFNLLVFVTSVW